MTTKYLFSILFAAQFAFVQIAWAVPQSQAYKDLNQAFAQVGFKSNRPLDVRSFEKKIKANPQMYERFRQLIDVLKKQSALSVEFLSFEKDGQLYPRIAIHLGAESMHFDFYGEPDRFLRVAEVTFVESDFADPDVFFQKLMANSPSLRKRFVQQALRAPLEMTPQVWKFLSPYDQAMFMINLRMVHDAAADVLDKYKVKERVTAGLEQLFFETAYAEEGMREGACIVGGWESVYRGGRCSAATEDLKDRPESVNLTCPNSNDFACRPTLFGMNGDRPHCISRSRSVINYATRECGRKAPIGTPEEIKKLLESLMKVRSITNATTFTHEQVSRLVEGYNSDIEKAIQICSTGSHLDPNQNNSPDSACGVLETRKLNLQQALDALGVQATVTPPPAQSEPGVLGSCTGGAAPGGQGAAGGAPGAQGGTVNGIAGTVNCTQIPPAVAQAPAASSTPPPAVASSSRTRGASSEPGFFSRMWSWMGRNSGLLIGGLVLAGTAGAIYYLARPKKVKSNPLTYVEPVAPPNTGSLPTSPVTTNNTCCLINSVWVLDSNGCQGRLNVAGTSSNLSLCGGGGSIQSKPTTTTPIQSKPGRQ